MAKNRHLRVVGDAAPVTVNGTVPPRRVPKPAGARKHLTPSEVERLEEAAAQRGRYGHRDRTLIMVTFRHGLRVSELVALRWDQVDLAAGTLYVTRTKRGIPAVHPLRGPELRALKRLRREQGSEGPYIFTTERGGGPMTVDGVRKLVARIAQEAGLGHVHPHQLRHATGYYLASLGVDTRALQQYLGHASINNTTVYTALSPNRFKDFWKD